MKMQKYDWFAVFIHLNLTLSLASIHMNAGKIKGKIKYEKNIAQVAGIVCMSMQK